MLLPETVTLLYNSVMIIFTLLLVFLFFSRNSSVPIGPSVALQWINEELRQHNRFRFNISKSSFQY